VYLYHQYVKVSPDSSPPDYLCFHMYACVHHREPLFGAETISEIYEACSDGVMTRYTVPLLVDKIKKKILRGCVCVWCVCACACVCVVCVCVCVCVCVALCVCACVRVCVCVCVLKGSGASHSGEVALSGSRHQCATLAEAPNLFVHAIV
jgi:hypothetical protein